MNIPTAPQKAVLTQDNSRIKAETNNFFKQGDLKWSTGDTAQTKSDGLKLIIQGLQSLKIWITREHDQIIIDTLKNQYQSRYADVEEKMKYLEKYKKGELMTESNPHNGQQVHKGNGNAGGDGSKEDDKLQGPIADAIVTTKPNVKWDDIAGLKQAKASLQEAVILPVRFPQIFEGARKPWKGILMYGPPGTGKTFLAKACATEADGTFFSVSSSSLISKYVGESERLIKTLFQMARDKKPSIIFIDEIDSMCGARGEGQNEASRRVITEFLVQMQGVGNDDKGLLVLGATNTPWDLDTAIRRRFEKRIYIPLPDEEGRYYLIKHKLKGNPNDLTEEQIALLAKQTDGFSGSDIEVFIKESLMEPVKLLQTTNKFRRIVVNGKSMVSPVLPTSVGPDIETKNFMQIEPSELHIPPVSYNDFLHSVRRAKTSVSKDQLKQYEDWTNQFGQDG